MTHTRFWTFHAGDNTADVIFTNGLRYYGADSCHHRNNIGTDDTTRRTNDQRDPTGNIAFSDRLPSGWSGLFSPPDPPQADAFRSHYCAA